MFETRFTRKGLMKKHYALFAILFLVLVSSAAMSGETLVFGPYASGGPDFGVCSDTVPWANDTFQRTYVVTAVSDGSFEVAELFKGTFKTLAGPSPGGLPIHDGHPTCTTLIKAGIEGQLYADYVFHVPPGPSEDFNFTAHCPDGCTGKQFFSTFFNIDVDALVLANPPAFQFHYRTDHNGNFDQTDHGNTGDIHN